MLRAFFGDLFRTYHVARSVIHRPRERYDVALARIFRDQGVASG
jgi:hypothetical protein